MALNLENWYRVHPLADHPNQQLIGTGGEVIHTCEDCGISATQAEIDAGLEVQDRRTFASEREITAEPAVN